MVLTAAFAAVGVCAESAADVAGTETFTNPVIAVDWPDPAIWNGGDGWYYSVATRLRTIRRSRNLMEWEDAHIDPLTPRAGVRRPDRRGRIPADMLCG